MYSTLAWLRPYRTRVPDVSDLPQARSSVANSGGHLEFGRDRRLDIKGFGCEGRAKIRIEIHLGSASTVLRFNETLTRSFLQSGYHATFSSQCHFMPLAFVAFEGNINIAVREWFNFARPGTDSNRSVCVCVCVCLWSRRGHEAA